MERRVENIFITFLLFISIYFTSVSVSMFRSFSLFFVCYLLKIPKITKNKNKPIASCHQFHVKCVMKSTRERMGKKKQKKKKNLCLWPLNQPGMNNEQWVPLWETGNNSVHASTLYWRHTHSHSQTHSHSAMEWPSCLHSHVFERKNSLRSLPFCGN